jgi:hypothetical protein
MSIAPDSATGKHQRSWMQQATLSIALPKDPLLSQNSMPDQSPTSRYQRDRIPANHQKDFTGRCQQAFGTKGKII